eukprot:5370779-Pyramimonas_sp.AAC.1
MNLREQRSGPTFGVPARRRRVSFDAEEHGPSEKVLGSAGALGDTDASDSGGMARVMADIARNLDLSNKRA